MRSMWKGSVGFGMVNIPVKLYKATDDGSSVNLCNTHKECGTAVKEPKYCPKCEKMLTAADLQRAYPEDRKKEHCIPVTEADLASIPLKSVHAVQIDGFISAIPDVRYYDSVYILEPEEAGYRAYALLLKALEATGKIGIAKITTASKEHLAAIIPGADGLMFLVTLHWTEDIRKITELNRPDSEISEKELAMAKMLIDTLPQDIDLASYHNEYGEALKALIKAKKSGEEIPVVAESKSTPEVDLLEQLMASLKPNQAVTA